MPWQNIAEVFFMSKKLKLTVIILLCLCVLVSLLLYFVILKNEGKSHKDAVFVQNTERSGMYG